MTNAKTVYVGLSGGVDSSVSAMLLKEQGYNVVGVYMKNWSQDLPGMPCPWMDDYQDAKRIAVQLGIDFKMYDFETEYKQKVVDYMLDEFKAGRTPNPDVMCNQEVKFKLFLNTALEEGADYVATGHYARVAPPQNPQNRIQNSDGQDQNSKFKIQNSSVGLFMAKDDNKDQTYFLYRVTKKALERTIFPLGDLTKPEVRELAKKHNLATAAKKESMGICFVGKVGIKEFLLQYVEPKPGAIIEQNGVTIGEHDGAIFYTLGQRHGLNVGGGLPYYVVGKDMDKNEVYVTTDIGDERLWSKEIRFASAHWICGEENLEARIQNSDENSPNSNSKLQNSLFVRTRHRAQLLPVTSLTQGENGQWTAELGEEVKALTPGQSAVFYSGNQCLGGGIVV